MEALVIFAFLSNMNLTSPRVTPSRKEAEYRVPVPVYDVDIGPGT